MNKLFLAAIPLCLVAFSATAVAQQPVPAPGTPVNGLDIEPGAKLTLEVRIKAMNSVLDQMVLTADQRLRIKDLEDKFEFARKQLHDLAQHDSIPEDSGTFRDRQIKLNRSFNQNLLETLLPPERIFFRKALRVEMKKLQRESKEIHS